MSDNCHPADALALVRQQIRELKEQEGTLRQELIDLPRRERQGIKYEGKVIAKTRKQLNVDLLEEELGDISRFYKLTEFVMVITEKLGP